MKRLTRALWAAALVTGVATAQDPPKQDPPKKDESKQPAKPSTPAEEFAAVQKDMADAQTAAMKKFREAKDPQEKTRIREEFMASARKKILDVARKYPKDATTFQQVSRMGGKESYDFLVEHWIDDEKIGMASLQASQSGTPEAVAFIRTVSQKSKDNKVKGVATLALATALKSQADDSDEKQAATLLAEAEKIFEDIEKNHADLDTPFGPAGKYAKKNLFELRHLTIGKTAPEIDGKDVDDKPLKLSDYRGKVVLLDFWAHW